MRSLSDRIVWRSAGDTHPTLSLPVLAERRVRRWTSPLSPSSHGLSWIMRARRRRRRSWCRLCARRSSKDRDGWNQAIGSDGVQYFWHRRTRRSVLVLPTSASRRKRKKRRRKKRPKPTRPCAHAAHAPTVHPVLWSVVQTVQKSVP